MLVLSCTGSGRIERVAPILTIEVISNYSAERLPFDTVTYGRDLAGMTLKNADLQNGDLSLKASLFEQALASYRKVNRARFSALEKEGLVQREATAELSLGNAISALNIRSDHFRETRQSVDDLDPLFALLFAYAFGRSGNLEQSLAWFGKLGKNTKGAGVYFMAAEQGVSSLLRLIPPDRFEAMQKTWEVDPFIRNKFRLTNLTT